MLHIPKPVVRRTGVLFTVTLTQPTKDRTGTMECTLGEQRISGTLTILRTIRESVRNAGNRWHKTGRKKSGLYFFVLDANGQRTGAYVRVRSARLPKKVKGKRV